MIFIPRPPVITKAADSLLYWFEDFLYKTRPPIKRIVIRCEIISVYDLRLQ